MSAQAVNKTQNSEGEKKLFFVLTINISKILLSFLVAPVYLIVNSMCKH